MFIQEGISFKCPACGACLISKTGTLGGAACPMCAERTRTAQAARPDPWQQKRADREWEMAGLARQDGDRDAEQQHTAAARAIERGEA